MNQEPNQNNKNPGQPSPTKFRKPRLLIYLVVALIVLGIWMFSSGVFKQYKNRRINLKSIWRLFLHRKNSHNVFWTYNR